MAIKKLVKHAKKGNKSAIVSLITAEKDTYYRLAFSYLKNEHDAMDAIASMTIIIYEKIHQLKKPASFYAWSYTILVNLCKKMLNERKKVVPMEGYLDSLLDEKNHFQAADELNEIDYFLQKINADQREVIILHYLHDFDLQMIAQIMNVPVGTVKSRMYYGMKHMRELAREMEGDHGETVK